VLLKLDHLGIETIEKRLPGIREISIKFANVDPIKDPIPVVPTAHYQMGGIPTNFHGEVVSWKNGANALVPGFYAAGECGCASIHGANRLGTNSLTDLLVMGKSAALSVIEFVRREGSTLRDLPADAAELSRSRVARLDSQTKGEEVNDVRGELQRAMQAHCGVFRFPDLLTEGVSKVKAIAERSKRTQIKDKSRVFNTARVEALELDNLVETARATMVSAEARKESRGAHDRADFHKRDDVNWLKHSLWFRDGDRLDYKPVTLKPLTVETFEPKARVY
jgi:succinate dehydrogenase / fumarate reductase flavoprotein subunit